MYAVISKNLTTTCCGRLNPPVLECLALRVEERLEIVSVPWCGELLHVPCALAARDFAAPCFLTYVDATDGSAGSCL